MGTTTTTAIPYVEPGDQLANFPTQDKAKADRLEALLADTGWVSLTPVSGTGTCRYRVRAGWFHFMCSLNSVTSVAPDQSGQIVAAGVIPAAYRPITGLYVAGSMAGSRVCLGVVGNDGGVACWNPAHNTVNMTTVRLAITYPLEAKP